MVSVVVKEDQPFEEGLVRFPGTGYTDRRKGLGITEKTETLKGTQ